MQRNSRELKNQRLPDGAYKLANTERERGLFDKPKNHMQKRTEKTTSERERKGYWVLRHHKPAQTKKRETHRTVSLIHGRWNERRVATVRTLEPLPATTPSRCDYETLANSNHVASSPFPHSRARLLLFFSSAALRTADSDPRWSTTFVSAFTTITTTTTIVVTTVAATTTTTVAPTTITTTIVVAITTTTITTTTTTTDVITTPAIANTTAVVNAPVAATITTVIPAATIIVAIVTTTTVTAIVTVVTATTLSPPLAPSAAVVVVVMVVVEAMTMMIS
ncbi:hypothetical protein E2542_SST11458 [Spatholobus suberectus]|nr:hypothetical protein E2542_SST11458 [Spatholobus suberectus]